MKKSYLWFLAMLASLAPATALAQTIDLWAVDAGDKIFADTEPCDSPTIAASAAANEYESAQFAIRADFDAENVKLTVSPLVCEESGAQIDAQNVRLRPVGMIPIARNTDLAEDIVVRKAPCDFPEILWDRDALALKNGETQSVWVTIFVPKGTASGQYAGTIALKGTDFEKSIPVELEVFPFELPDARDLYVTNWWTPWNIVKYHNVKYMSEEFWKVLEAYFKNMGEHRQNVIYVPWSPNGRDDFVSATLKADGSWSFDFSRLERMIDLAEKYGVADRIELHHFGGIDREKHEVSFSSATIINEETGELQNSPFEQWFAPTLTALCKRLRETGRFEKTMLHVADEPYQPDVDSWRAAATIVKNVEPEIKLIDAIEAVNFSDKLDVWVPKLSHFERWRKAFEARRANNEFWYYICCHPYGSHYPNRFMDLPAARLRVLHWLNYTENLTGYLHWGFNYWFDDAFGAPITRYSPGDGHVVYPTKDGLLDSIRWELQRESLEDYEYLKLLEKSVDKIKSEYAPEKVWAFDAKSRSMELARRVLLDIAHSTLDYGLIEKTRRELADEIVAATGDVRLVVQTFPVDGATVYAGPILGELYGITTPGATVTINGDEIKVEEDGLFAYQINLKDTEDTVLEIVATLDGKSVKTTRTFHIE